MGEDKRMEYICKNNTQRMEGREGLTVNSIFLLLQLHEETIVQELIELGTRLPSSFFHRLAGAGAL